MKKQVRLFQAKDNNRFMPVNIFCLESLILAQNERWRHGLGMQVERFKGATL